MRNVLNFNASWLFAKQTEVPAALPAALLVFLRVFL